MNWRDAVASLGGVTPSHGYLWPSEAGGRIGVRAAEVERDRLRQEVESQAARDRLLVDVVEAAAELVDARIEGEGEREAEAWAAVGAALGRLDASEPNLQEGT